MMMMMMMIIVIIIKNKQTLLPLQITLRWKNSGLEELSRDEPDIMCYGDNILFLFFDPTFTHSIIHVLSLFIDFLIMHLFRMLLF